MAASPPPSSSAIPPSSSSGFQSPPPPSSLSPPPASSVPPISQPNATPHPPTSSTPSPPSSPPPQSTAPPPSIPSPPPSLPASPPPPVASTPPTSPNAPPPTSPNAPPPTSPSPPPPTVSSPPPSVTPPTPTLSPPPSASPPPTLPSSPPPSPPAASPPPPRSSPVTVLPPSPSISQSPPPPPPIATPPTGSSQPPPLANPPAASPPPSVAGSPPPSGSLTPPSNPSAPPPKKHPPSGPSAPPPKNQPPSIPSPPGNSSSGATPAVPSVPSPPGPSISPPVPSPTFSSGNPATPNSPGFNRSSDFSPKITAGQGGRNFTGGGGINTGTAVSIAVVAGLLILSLVGVAAWFVRRRRRQVGGYNAGFVMPSPLTSSQVSEASYPKSPTAPLAYNSSGSHGFINSSGNPGLGNSKSWFTYEELHEITSGFSSKNLLGEGGFGCVYKGCLSDGREVAVKQLKVGGGQGEREFKAEVEIISRVHHRHLVSLVGYCISDNQRLLVYDFVPNDTLDFHLHGEGRPVMDWATRVRVAAGAARGIAYLHEDCHPRIIHRDIKSSNILIDNNFEAQVADFGLAKLAMDAATHVTTRVMGTFGYMAPEYASTGKLTDRSDVYSFGVVLLELITGRKPVDASQPMGDESLVEWARPMLTHALDTGDFEGLPDPRLEKNYNESEMFRMIEAAAACVRHSASMRPRMGLVVRALDSLAESDLNNGVKPGQSELFAAPQSAEIRMFQRMAFGSQDYSSDFSRSSWNSRSGL